MSHIQYTKEEVAARAKTLYEQAIRAHVEPENTGKYLVIDIDSGEYLMDDDEIALMKRAALKYSPYSLYGLRIGQRTMGRFAGAQRNRADNLSPR